MKNSSPCIFSLLLLCLINLVAGQTRQDVINSCSNRESCCLGFNSADAAGADDCSSDVSKCQFAFVSLTRADANSYNVRLVGKGSGWVSIAFSDDETGIMRGDNLGVVCVNGKTPVVQILEIQQRPGLPNVMKKPLQFDNSALAQSVSNAKLQLNDGWMICEFKLNSRPRHGKRSLDLAKRPYKIGLAGNGEKGVDDSTAEYANQPVYHGETRGSSARKLDVFQNL